MMMPFRLLVLLSITWLLLACSPLASPPDLVSGGDFVLTFAQAGVYRLPPALEPAAIVHGEQSLPLWQAQTADGPLTFFFVPVTSTRASRLDALFYESQTPALLATPLPPLPLSTTDAQTTTSAHHWREQDLLYQSQADFTLPWLWARLIAPASWQDEITLPIAATGPYTLTLRVWGQTASASFPDHHLQVLWDGDLLSDESWDGARIHSLIIPMATVTPGRHHLTVHVPGDTGAAAEVLFLDGWGIDYQQPLDLRQEPVNWLATAPAARMEVTVGESIWLLDITDPFTPVAFGPALVDISPTTLATEPGHRYWAGTASQIPPPPRQRTRSPLTPQSLQALAKADEIIVGVEALLQAVQPLVAYRESNGLKVATLTPTQLLDHWGRGVPDSSVLRQFLRWRQEQKRLPRYILLLGDAELAPWQGNSDILRTRIPTAFITTPYLGETPSDAALLGDVAGNVALGRIPARSPAEVDAIVQKILTYEQNPTPRRHLILNDGDAEFVTFAAEIAAFWQRQGDTVARFNTTSSLARPAILEALQEGPAWLHYVGHGSPLLWSRAQILTVEDASSWSAPALVLAWTCLSGYFSLPDGQSLAERWLLTAQGGAVAVIAPTGEEDTAHQQLFADTFYRALTDSNTLGLALARTRARLTFDGIALQYQLFGDPALRLTP